MLLNCVSGKRSIMGTVGQERANLSNSRTTHYEKALGKEEVAHPEGAVSRV